MSDKALRMLKHMCRQLWMQGTRDASVRRAALSIGVEPEGEEFDALVEELLRGGYIEHYPSPTLAVEGLYRVTNRGIAAADEGKSRDPLP
jgi:hypothetical protein